MNKYEMLFVRACKSRNPAKRVRSVYSRFYLRNSDETENTFYIAGIIANICDKYHPISTSNLFTALHPGNKWKYGIEDDESYWASSIKIMISHLRLSEVSKFEGYIGPGWSKRPD